MRLSIVFAQVLAASVMAAPLRLARRDGQEIEAEAGDSISGGSAAINNPNVNNGFQVDSSLITNGGAGQGDFINNAFGNSITHINSNSANKGNIVINPTTVTSNGNNGLTANGDGNGMGNTLNGLLGFRKRQVVVSGDRAPFDTFPEFPGFNIDGSPAVNLGEQAAVVVQNQF